MSDISDPEFAVEMTDAMATLFIDAKAACDKAMEAGEKPLDVYGNLTSEIVSWLVVDTLRRGTPPEIILQMLRHAVSSGVEKGHAMDHQSDLN